MLECGGGITFDGYQIWVIMVSVREMLLYMTQYNVDQSSDVISESLQYCQAGQCYYMWAIILWVLLKGRLNWKTEWKKEQTMEQKMEKLY